MKTLYIEGLANHDDPESCVGDPRGRSEALTGVHAGWAIEPRNGQVRGADALVIGGRPHRGQRYRELPADLARSKNLCMRGVSTAEVVPSGLSYDPAGIDLSTLALVALMYRGAPVIPVLVLYTPGPCRA